MKKEKIKVELENGFLDDKMNLHVDCFRKENKEIYNILEKINKLCYKIARESFTEGINNKIVYILSKFSQIHLSFQSYILLFERGLYEDSKIILRSIYDKTIDLLFVDSYDNAIYLIIYNTLREKKTLYNYIDDKHLYKYMKKKDIDKESEKINNEIDELKKIPNIEYNKKTVRDKCEFINKEELYIQYKYNSIYTHNDIYVQDDRINKEKSEYIIDNNLKFGNIYNEITFLLGIFDYSMRIICKTIDKNEYYNEFDKLLNDFCQTIKLKHTN